jgi:hypothetical protein
MTPVSSNSQNTNQGCTPTSSNCIVWQGPDIACINLCAGDNITDVVYKLAMQLCTITDNLFDITQIDASCLLEPGQSTPATQEALMQLMIDKICVALACCGSGGGSTPTAYYDLPECLWYTDGDGNTVTQLAIGPYVEYLASKICDIITQISTINATLENHEIRITDLENATPPTPAEVTITTQCASGPTPGVVLPISTAFQNFESTFCELSGILGSTDDLNGIIAMECAGLDLAPQLNNPTYTMSDMAGWVTTPTTLAENINNMWLTICDMRAKVSTCCSEATLPCLLLPVTNITSSDIVIGSATISWFLPATSGVAQPPSGYIINIYEWNGTNIVGSSLYTDTVTHPTNTITFDNSTLTVGQSYAVVITTLYPCGSINAQLVSYLVPSMVDYCVMVTDAPLTSDITVTCKDTAYPVTRHRVTAQLIQSSTGLPFNNPLLTNLSIEVMFSRVDQCGTTLADTTTTMLIPPGSSTITFDYNHLEKMLCSGTNTCADFTTTYSGAYAGHSLISPYTFCDGTAIYIPA